MEQTTTNPLEDYTAVIKDLTVLAKQIAKLENSKAQASSAKRHELLDSFIQEEQACILKLRGLEQHRIRLSQALGWDSLTFRQILDKEPQRRTTLEPLFLELEAALNGLQQARKSAEQIIKVRIHEIDIAIALQQGGSYDNAGNVNVKSPRHPKMKDTYI